MRGPISVAALTKPFSASATSAGRRRLSCVIRRGAFNVKRNVSGTCAHHPATSKRVQDYRGHHIQAHDNLTLTLLALLGLVCYDVTLMLARAESLHHLEIAITLGEEILDGIAHVFQLAS